MLTDSGLEPKELTPTVPAEGKPPVKLIILDTEEHEATYIAQVRTKAVLVAAQTGRWFLHYCAVHVTW